MSWFKITTLQYFSYRSFFFSDLFTNLFLMEEYQEIVIFIYIYIKRERGKTEDQFLSRNVILSTV